MWKSLLNHYFQDNGTIDLDKSELKYKSSPSNNVKHTCKFEYQK